MQQKKPLRHRFELGRKFIYPLGVNLGLRDGRTCHNSIQVYIKIDDRTKGGSQNVDHPKPPGRSGLSSFRLASQPSLVWVLP